MRTGRRYRRSDASQVVGDVAYISNRLPWWGALAIGVITFVILYWLIPGWAESRMEAMGGKPVGIMLRTVLEGRLHHVQMAGVAALLVSVFFAVRNLLVQERLSSKGERGASLVSRLMAKFLS